jgi:hypothetical protein
MTRSEAARQLPVKLEEKGWSQAHLTKVMSDDLGHVADGLVNRWIKGSREPSGAQVGWLQKHLGIDAFLWTMPSRPSRRMAAGA